MPKGSKVHRLKEKLMRQGKSEAQAIRIAQTATGKSYKTGRQPKRRRKK